MFVFLHERVPAVVVWIGYIYITCVYDNELLSGRFFNSFMSFRLKNQVHCISTNVLIRTNDQGMASLEVTFKFFNDFLISDMLTYSVIRDIDYLRY